jgi:hypothetical protein
MTDAPRFGINARRARSPPPKAAGATKIFREKASDARGDRSELTRA